MNLEEERDWWRKKAQAAEGILGFVLLVLDRPVYIEKTVIDSGYPEGSGIYVDTEDEGMEVGLRTNSEG